MTKGDSSSKPPAPKLQTITLKAFVHCEGCRRKIRRIIRILDGVEDVVVDTPTGKVTVTGTDIDVKTILQRLQKYGKQAEVWPSSVAALPPASKPAGENQPKPATNNNNNNPDNNSKKKNNAGGESGSGKAEGGTGNEGKKGGGKKEDQVAPVEEKGEEVPASQKKPEKSKETNGNTEAGNANTSQQSGGGSGGGGGGGGGKKGKKGGNGNNNGNSGGGGGGGGGGNNGGGGGGGGGGGIPELLPPPSLVQDRPIASVPTTTSITVSANKAHYDSVQTGYADYNSVDYATHMFSDENANNCSIM